MMREGADTVRSPIKKEWRIAPFPFANALMVLTLGVMIMANVQKSKDGR
jgi:hypothetical protein